MNAHDLEISLADTFRIFCQQLNNLWNLYFSTGCSNILESDPLSMVLSGKLRLYLKLAEATLASDAVSTTHLGCIAR